MTRFVMIADTHAGASPMGYTRQTPYPERLGAIVEALGAWMDQWGQADFVLHAGDLLDATTSEAIAESAEILGRLPAPTFLALGNHDLTTPDAMDLWLAGAPHLIGSAESEGPAGNFSLRIGDLQIHTLVTQWSEIPDYWEEGLDARFTPAQWEWLEGVVAEAPEAAHVLLTHSQVLPVPIEQTQTPTPLHDSSAAFKAEFEAFCAKYPQIRAVLGGHSHMNMHVERAGVHYVTGSALVESPFEFKCFEFDENEPDSSKKLKMTTESLLAFAPGLVGPADYDNSAAFVQGRPQDRAF